MSARKIGGGRILGSGKGLAPPDARQTLNRTAIRSSSPFAPSDASSNSRGSHPPSRLSPSPTSSQREADQDLTANISLGAPSARSGGAGLVCPICGEEMVTLLQLNRHIDDIHQELPEVQQDEVKTWFDKQVLKAKKFQPLSIINQKLRGLDVFEPNTSPLLVGPSGFGGFSSAQRPGTESTPVAAVAAVDPDELITRKHWQRQTPFDMCTDPTCAKGLGPINGSVNCRKCGKLFCEAHTMYQIRLSRAAAYDPLRGFWARVCETCYKSRPGYNDHRGAERDWTAAFVAVRQKRIERQNLDIARLEKRLTRLTQMLAEVQVVASMPHTPTSPTDHHKPPSRKALEQSVVTWEEDAAVSRCPFCQQEFGTWSFRRHHCRICGRVVCADNQTACSTEVGLSVAVPAAIMTTTTSATSTISTAGSEKAVHGTPKTPTTGHASVDVRMCRECKTTIFSKRDFADALAHKPADQRAYETLRQFEWGIRQLMPLFQRALQALQVDGGSPTGPGSTKSATGTARRLDHRLSMPLPPPPPPVVTHAQIQEAAKIRKRLMDSFTKYNLAATRLRDLPTTSATQQRLQRAVYTAASTFLHAHMVPLKHVPRMLRAHQKTSTKPSPHRKMLSNLNHGDGDAASLAGSEASTVVSALEAEEKDLREKLIVLEEQRFLVQQMVDNARGSRRFEEVGALSRNVEELDGEIARLRKQVGGVEHKWEDLYAAGASA